MLSRAEKAAELERVGLEWRAGSLLKAPHAIAHQCYCTIASRGAAGLAAHIFAENPKANVYRRRAEPAQPGTASFHDIGIINLYAQLFPGIAAARPRPEDSETYAQRIEWLRAALSAARAIVLQKQGSHLALPAGIGCDLAGGNWAAYCDALAQWQRENADMTLVFYVL